MTDFIPPWPVFSAFLLAGLALAVTPGPGVLYIATRSLLQGWRAGLVSVAGVALGNLGNACIASVGLAALFAASSTAYLLVKYGGALYLALLGVRMWRSGGAQTAPGIVDRKGLAGLFRDGFIVALFNPKTAFFFAAFLPQFLMPGKAPMAQALLLGSLFVAIAALTDSAYALSASVVTRRLAQNGGFRRLGRGIAGGIFVGLGLFAALTGVRGAG